MDLKLEHLREQKGITQKKLCDALNISTSTYNKYETSDVEPKIDMLIKLADYYNVSVDYLIGHDTSKNFGYLSESETQLIEAFRKLKDSSKYKVLGYTMSELEK